MELRNTDKPGAPNMRSNRTVFGVSDDGIHFEMSPETIRVHYKGEILPWICDARLTVQIM